MPLRHYVEEREDTLLPRAARSKTTRGRDKPEEPCDLRGEFQRDRDRILHSKSFRRLKHKTQVFIAPAGDHYVTRLTHTLEVSQIARTIARALNLNEDLTEAISLGHDLGHTPFGHTGENVLNGMYPEGFRHAEQSLRIVEHLEKEGDGLNLTWEVRKGIVSHSKPKGDFFGDTVPKNLSLEGQVCRVSDAIAYLNHDMADAFRAGALTDDQIPREVNDVLGARHSQRVHTMVSDIVVNSWPNLTEEHSGVTEDPSIIMSDRVRRAVNVLRDFMFEHIYLPKSDGNEGQAAKKIVRSLFEYYSSNLDELPPPYTGKTERSAIDYVAGMTDHYAIRAAERITPGISEPLREGLA